MLADLLDPTEAGTAGTPPEYVRPWAAITDRHQALVIEPREGHALQGSLDMLAAGAPFCLNGRGPVDGAVAALGAIPSDIRADITDLAQRFVALMRVPDIRLRFELLTDNACRRIHVDYTDVRLITTYHGPGTQVAMGLPDDADPPLWTIPTGHVGLFKGKRFGEGHAVCRHRSPPAGDMGARRIILVIDTPGFPREQASS